MKPGHASQTAVMVAMGRAIAHRSSTLPLTDPTALPLLPDDAQKQVERFEPTVPPKGVRARFRWEHLRRQARMMTARTIALDDAIRQAAAPQLVILGAGLDGRAWRMAELAPATVFEVDHPDSQRDKRARVFGLSRAARDVRFVSVDFAKDDLEQSLAAAGHDPSLPTTWLWEGVVMYLDAAAIDATLSVVKRRSAVGSRIAVVYHSPGLLLWLVRPMVRRLGEPIRSVHTPEGMRRLLEKHGFEVTRDQGLPELGRAISVDVAEATRIMKHIRLVVADRRGAP
ncbi:MAG: class I SAM-dependent methyltransferase [Myxococcales bacterium]|nr:class I SAM-dependent methyltransferase [Myxococcales bacterium]